MYKWKITIYNQKSPWKIFEVTNNEWTMSNLISIYCSKISCGKAESTIIGYIFTDEQLLVFELFFDKFNLYNSLAFRILVNNLRSSHCPLGNSMKLNWFAKNVQPKYCPPEEHSTINDKQMKAAIISTFSINEAFTKCILELLEVKNWINIFSQECEFVENLYYKQINLLSFIPHQRCFSTYFSS